MGSFYIGEQDVNLTRRSKANSACMCQNQAGQVFYKSCYLVTIRYEKNESDKRRERVIEAN